MILFKIKIKFITCQLTFRSNLISLRPVSACTPTPQTGTTTGATELWRSSHRGRARHVVHAQALHPCLVATLVWQLPAFGGRPAAKPVRPCHRSSAAMEPLPSSVLAVDKPPPPSVLMALLRNHYWDRRFEELGLRSCGWGFRNSRDRGGVRALGLSLRLAT